jgi:hypothetical protein
MPHYNTPAEERVAIEDFQKFTEEQVKPEIQSLMTAKTKKDFERKRDSAKEGAIIREWQTKFGTFIGAHDVANLNAAASIAQEVTGMLRDALSFKQGLPEEGGRRKTRRRRSTRKPRRSGY